LLRTHPNAPEEKSLSGPVFWRNAWYPNPLAKDAFGVGQDSEKSPPLDSTVMEAKNNAKIPGVLAIKLSLMTSFFDFLIQVVFAG